jgi:hypothetical protein
MNLVSVLVDQLYYMAQDTEDCEYADSINGSEYVVTNRAMLNY